MSTDNLVKEISETCPVVKTNTTKQKKAKMQREYKEIDTTNCSVFFHFMMKHQYCRFRSLIDRKEYKKDDTIGKDVIFNTFFDKKGNIINNREFSEILKGTHKEIYYEPMSKHEESVWEQKIEEKKSLMYRGY